MSYDATIVINMDAVDQICNDLKFGEKVYNECCKIHIIKALLHTFGSK